jgi:hypothetical protein
VREFALPREWAGYHRSARGAGDLADSRGLASRKWKNRPTFGNLSKFHRFQAGKVSINPDGRRFVISKINLADFAHGQNKTVF